ncbi:hypothetical protein JZO73_15130, partial [Enterococcus plantarum]|uniref:polymorphic toxin-type HINT domain-containing protein n=1 Tax=Enterococcus plantarum TaxID=1077675 RepID=UPI001AC3AEEE
WVKKGKTSATAADIDVTLAYNKWLSRMIDKYGLSFIQGDRQKGVDELFYEQNATLIKELATGIDSVTGKKLTQAEMLGKASLLANSMITIGVMVKGVINVGKTQNVKPRNTNKKASGAKCFVSGTLILTEHGHKPIESIQIGEKVLANHENSHVQTYEKVVQIFVSETSKLVRITIDNEMIETTEEHPFYLPSKGWIKAKELTYNDDLIDRFGNTLSITGIHIISLNKPVKVYNFEVENAHTYFVSNLSILVHNICDDALNKWHKGTFADSEASLTKHFEKHGAEVKASSLEQYLNKAEDFSRKLKGARTKKIDYPTPNVVRYYKNGKYIDIHKPTGKIISFGKQ